MSKTLKKSLALLLAVVMCLSLMSVGVWADGDEPEQGSYSVTDTTNNETYNKLYKVAEGFYQDGEKYDATNNFYITSKNGLKYFRDWVNGTSDALNIYAVFLTLSLTSFATNNGMAGKNVHLLADIDLTDEVWQPIGPNSGAVPDKFNSSWKAHFYGNFYGHNHVVSNMDTSKSDQGDKYSRWPQGFFGSIAASGTVIDGLVLENVKSVSEFSGGYAGAIVGDLGSNAITISNCVVRGNIEISGGYSGAIYGIGNGNVLNCTVTGDSESSITGTYFAGGLVGAERCSATSDLQINSNTVSGVEITSSQFAGGLVGAPAAGAKGKLEIANNTVQDTVTLNGNTGNSNYIYCANADSSTNVNAHDNIFPQPKVAEVRGAQYTTLEAAIAAANDDDTITLLADVDLDAQINVTKKLTLNLGGHAIKNTSDIWNTDASEWSLISVRNGGDLTITGNGQLLAKENDCYAVDVRDGANLVIENGEYSGNITAIYGYKGSVVIHGGSFKIKQLSDKNDYRFTLNLYDENRRNGTASFSVDGGTFYNFNPGNNLAEGAGTNFLADGYGVKANEDDTFTVVPLTNVAAGETVTIGAEPVQNSSGEEVIPANAVVTVAATATSSETGTTASELTYTDESSSETKTVYVVSDGTTTKAIDSSVITTTVEGKKQNGADTSEAATAKAGELFKISEILADAGTTDVSFVEIQMSSASVNVNEDNKIPSGVSVAFEVHPVAIINGNTSNPVRVSNYALIGGQYEATVALGSAYANQQVFMRHIKSDGSGIENLGLYTADAEGNVTIKMNSFSVVYPESSTSNYTVSIADATDGTADVAGDGVQTFTMDVKVTDTNDTNTKFIYASGTVEYDKNLFELTGITKSDEFDVCGDTTWTTLTDNAISAQNGQNGKFAFELKATDGTTTYLPSGTTLLTLTFKAKQLTGTDDTSYAKTGSFAVTDASAATVVDTQQNAKYAQTTGDAVRVLSTYDVTKNTASTVDDVTGTAGIEVADVATGFDKAVYGKDYTIAITNFDTNYDYTVKYTIGTGSAQTVELKGADYTSHDSVTGHGGTVVIPGASITGNLSFTVTRKLAIEVNVYSDYVSGYYLVTVKNTGAKKDTTVYNYGAPDVNATTSNMFKYTKDGVDYFAILVPKTDYPVDNFNSNDPQYKTLTVEMATALVQTINKAVRGAVTAGVKDVNGTGLVDTNDYLRIFVCYRVLENVDEFMADYLRADYTKNGKVTSADFAALYLALHTA